MASGEYKFDSKFLKMLGKFYYVFGLLFSFIKNLLTYVEIAIFPNTCIWGKQQVFHLIIMLLNKTYIVKSFLHNLDSTKEYIFTNL